MDKLKFSIALFFALSLCTKNGVCQPFSYVELGSRFLSPKLLNTHYSSRWELTNGFSLSAHTPFYIGMVGVNISKFDYKTIATGIRIFDFESINYSVDFGYRIEIHQNVSAFGAIGTGVQKLTNRYKVSNGYIYTDEREIFYLAKFEPRFELKHVVMFGSIEYWRVFNYKRQHVLFTGAGIRFRLFLPEKWQEFIR